MRCIVTGGCGFIGSHVVDALIDEGHHVLAIDNLSTGSLENLNKASEFEKADIRDLSRLQFLFRGADYVFHLAALARIQPSFDDPLEHEAVNVVGTVNCILAARMEGVRKVILSSSSAIYGNPKTLPTPETEPPGCLSPYALQKYTAEQYSILLGKRYGLPVVVLRYFNVYGPRSFNIKNPHNAYTSVVGIFSNQKRSGVPLTITGDGLQSRDFVHVWDVARANLIAATSECAGEIYNIGFARAITIRDLALLFSHPLQYIEERKGEARITLAEISKAKRELSWTPTIDIERGIKSYFNDNG